MCFGGGKTRNPPALGPAPPCGLSPCLATARFPRILAAMANRDCRLRFLGTAGYCASLICTLGNVCLPPRKHSASGQPPCWLCVAEPHCDSTGRGSPWVHVEASEPPAPSPARPPLGQVHELPCLSFPASPYWFNSEREGLPEIADACFSLLSFSFMRITLQRARERILRKLFIPSLLRCNLHANQMRVNYTCISHFKKACKTQSQLYFLDRF